MKLTTWRIVVILARDGVRKSFKCRAYSSRDALDTIARKYRGDQPVILISYTHIGEGDTK